MAWSIVVRSVLAWGFLVVAGAGGGCVQDTLTRYTYARVQMGVRSQVTVYSADEPRARDAAAAAFEEINRLEDLFSDYRPRSELSRVSDRAGSPAMDRGVEVSPEMAEVLRLAKDLHGRTGGAFDVTVGACTRLWRETRRAGVLPEPAVLERARATVGSEALEVTAEGRVRLTRAGARLDFGGIAKGYAAQRAVNLLKSRGSPRCLVALAGDVVAGDPPPGAAGWRVGLASGREAEGESPTEGVILLTNLAVSTSGDAAQAVEIGGVRYAHIVDPRTGLGARFRRAASVVARRGELADAVGKAAYLLGAEGVRGLAGELGVAVVVVDEDATPRVVEVDPEGLIRRP